MRPNFVGAAQVENPLLNLRLHASRAMARAARTVQQSLHATFTETTYPLVSRGTRDTHGLRCGSGCPAGSHPLHKELPAIWSKARSTIQLRALHVPDLHNPDRARGLSLCQQGPWELQLGRQLRGGRRIDQEPARRQLRHSGCGEVFASTEYLRQRLGLLLTRDHEDDLAA